MKNRMFTIIVLAYLGFLGFINVMMFIPGNWMSNMTGDTHDLIHELVFALIIGTAAMGLFDHRPPAYEVGHEQKHAALGHYRNIAAFSFIVILVGILASLRPPGWRLAAWTAGFFQSCFFSVFGYAVKSQHDLESCDHCLGCCVYRGSRINPGKKHWFSLPPLGVAAF